MRKTILLFTISPISIQISVPIKALQQVPGIGQALAERIHSHLHD
jgi:Holliday junction resolvasome RuvABC DNA-binding subunit